jgi:Ohr subfamily peroxiredoxin
MTHLYETRVTVVGGRDGTATSDDGQLSLALATPVELGGRGGGTNPEQLFAAGYAACFETAVIHVTRRQVDRVRDEDISVTATVGLVDNGKGGFALTATLDVVIAGVDQSRANEIIRLAHDVCPYSNALKGNVDVRLVARGT